MTRGTLPLILVNIILISQILLGLGKAECSDEYIADISSSYYLESEKYSTVNQQAQVTADDAATQYLLGVIEYNEGNEKLAKIWFQRAWESLGAEAGRIDTLGDNGLFPKTQEFGRALDKSLSQTTLTKIKFPADYKIDVYYRDGWYLQPKNSSSVKKQVYSFLPGSTYKIRIEAENEQIIQEKFNTGMKIIGALVMISWLISR